MFFVRHHISIDQQGNMHDRQFMRVGVSVVAKIKFKVPAKKDSLDVNSCLYIYSVTFLSESKINSHNYWLRLTIYSSACSILTTGL
jgi:hypothetical protein